MPRAHLEETRRVDREGFGGVDRSSRRTAAAGGGGIKFKGRWLTALLEAASQDYSSASWMPAPKRRRSQGRRGCKSITHHAADGRDLRRWRRRRSGRALHHADCGSRAVPLAPTPGWRSGPSAPQSVGAQLHHQPTPGSVEGAEHKAREMADAALDRARKADAAGDAERLREGACRCQRALRAGVTTRLNTPLRVDRIDRAGPRSVEFLQ